MIFIIKYQRLLSKFDKNYLSLVIAPTLACNFACTYCYESGHTHSKRITKSTEDEIINFINQFTDLKYIRIV